MRPLATWNPATDRWETAEQTIFGHSVVFSETWPTSGMTRRGVAFELPTWEPPTVGSGSLSLLRTPCAAEAEGGPLSPSTAAERGQTLRLTGQILDLIHPGILD